MNETIEHIDLTDEQLETVAGGTDSNSITNSIYSANSASADQYNILVGSWIKADIGGSNIQQVNYNWQSASITPPQPKKTPWSW